MKVSDAEIKELGDTLKEWCQKSGFASMILSIDTGDGRLFVAAGGRDNREVMMNLAELTRRVTQDMMPELHAQIEEHIKQRSGNDVEIKDIDRLMASEFTKVSKLVH